MLKVGKGWKRGNRNDPIHSQPSSQFPHFLLTTKHQYEKTWKGHVVALQDAQSELADAKEQVAGGPSGRLWAFEFDIAHVAHELDRTEEAQGISNSPFFKDMIKHQMLMAGLYRFNNLHIYNNNIF